LSSNHTPFEFPDDWISLYDAEKNTDNNAAKYADHSSDRQGFGPAGAGHGQCGF
jgi:hypothetical protein